MSIGYQNENTTNPDQSNQDPEALRLHPIARVFLWTFIIINAYVIIFGLIPAIFSIPVLRHLAIPTFWRFHAGYGTPLGLTLVPAIVMSVISALQILICVCFLKRIKIVTWKNFFKLSIALAVVCIGVTMWISESLEDYVRESLLRDMSNEVQVEASFFIDRRRYNVSISTTTELVSESDFQAFVEDVHSLVFRAMQMRMVREYSISVILFRAGSGDYRMDCLNSQRLLWITRRVSYTYTRNLPDGEYGILHMDRWATNMQDTLSRPPAFGDLSASHLLPTSNIQETIDAVMFADNFVRELRIEMQMPTSANVVRVLDDENTPNIIGAVYGNVNVRIFHISDLSLLNTDEIQESLIEIDKQTRSVAESHDATIQRFWVSFNRDLFDDSIVDWISWGDGDYGRLIIRGTPEHRFEDIHISEVQELINSLRN